MRSLISVGLNCCSSVAKLCLTLCDPMDCSTPDSPVLHHLPELLKLMSIESVLSSNHLILCCPLLLLPSIFPSIRAYFNELALQSNWPKYWSFSISPSSEYLRLISFRIDWLVSLFPVSLSFCVSHTSTFVSLYFRFSHDGGFLQR